MKLKFIIIFSIILTLFSVVFQKMTGPTYPANGSVDLSGNIISYKLERSHSGLSKHAIRIKTGGEHVKGTVLYVEIPSYQKFSSFNLTSNQVSGIKNIATTDWTRKALNYSGGYLEGNLPALPPKGKYLYQIELSTAEHTKLIPEQPVMMRFKGEVPLYYLVPHIILIFLAFLFSNMAGLFAAFNLRHRFLSFSTLLFLIFGGLILGAIIQKYAFGAYWTGVPFGYDVTDNKALIATICWFVAFAFSNKKDPRVYTIIASITMFVIFLIPHSLYGS